MRKENADRIPLYYYYSYKYVMRLHGPYSAMTAWGFVR